MRRGGQRVAERRVDLVRDARDQRAERGHLLRLDEVLLRLAQRLLGALLRGDVEHDAVEAAGPALLVRAAPSLGDDPDDAAVQPAEPVGRLVDASVTARLLRALLAVEILADRVGDPCRILGMDVAFPDIVVRRGKLLVAVAQHPVEFLRPPAGAAVEIHLPDGRAGAGDREVQPLLAGAERVRGETPLGHVVQPDQHRGLAGEADRLGAHQHPDGTPVLCRQGQLATRQPLPAGEGGAHHPAILGIGQETIERRPGAPCRRDSRHLREMRVSVADAEIGADDGNADRALLQNRGCGPGLGHRLRKVDQFGGVSHAARLPHPTSSPASVPDRILRRPRIIFENCGLAGVMASSFSGLHE